jgi:hypothetical protein
MAGTAVPLSCCRRGCVASAAFESTRRVETGKRVRGRRGDQREHNWRVRAIIHPFPLPRFLLCSLCCADALPLHRLIDERVVVDVHANATELESDTAARTSQVRDTSCDTRTRSSQTTVQKQGMRADQLRRVEWGLTRETRTTTRRRRDVTERRPHMHKLSSFSAVYDMLWTPQRLKHFDISGKWVSTASRPESIIAMVCERFKAHSL